MLATFGERLALLRGREGLSQVDMARKLQIAKSTLAMYETNKREPSFETLNLLAEYFNVTLDYLLGRPENVTANNPLYDSPLLVSYDGHVEKLSKQEAVYLSESLEVYRIMKDKKRSSGKKKD